MRHKFVEEMPSEIEDGVLYISIEYDVAKHKCACGCGAEIVTSLSPARYSLIYDGETVSLYPSIGNWTHKCQSHYFIRNNQVIWANRFDNYTIEQVLKRDDKDLKSHLNKQKSMKLFLKKIFKNNSIRKT